MRDSAERRSGGSEETLSLQVAYATLNDLLLDRPDTQTFLHRIAELATSIVPGARCSIALERSRADAVARIDASNTQVAIPRQRSLGPGRARRDRAGVTEQVPGGVSLPLVVDGTTIGTLSLYSDTSQPLSDTDLDHARAFAHQSATAIILLLRESAHLALDEQLQEAQVTRAVIDQAMGVLMHARRISGRQALTALRRDSQTANRKVSVLAAELVLEMTGHPPERPRPLTVRHERLPHQNDDIVISGQPQTNAPRRP